MGVKGMIGASLGEAPWKIAHINSSQFTKLFLIITLVQDIFQILSYKIATLYKKKMHAGISMMMIVTNYDAIKSVAIHYI
jgi:hypothetical protein